MLDSEDPTTQTPADEAKPPRRRRAASRPAGPPEAPGAVGWVAP